jgi:hypothetical protein
MKLKFLQMLDNLVNHIFTKFRGIWIYTLGYINFSLKGIKSARKVHLLNIFGVTLIERSSNWNHVYKCLRYLSLVLD